MNRLYLKVISCFLIFFFSCNNNPQKFQFRDGDLIVLESEEKISKIEISLHDSSVTFEIGNGIFRFDSVLAKKLGVIPIPDNLSLIVTTSKDGKKDFEEYQFNLNIFKDSVYICYPFRI